MRYSYMIHIKLEGMEPFSINSAYYKNRTRTREYRAWTEKIWKKLQLKYNSKQLGQFKYADEPLSILIIYSMPNLLTKAGAISRKSKDLTNVEKTLVDGIMEPRYDGREMPNGMIVETLGIDDKNIVYLQSHKRLADDYRIDIYLERVKNL